MKTESWLTRIHHLIRKVWAKALVDDSGYSSYTSQL